MIQQPQYMSVENRPIPCSFCSATVNGRVMEKIDPASKETTKECRWICSRCGNLVKVGTISK